MSEHTNPNIKELSNIQGTVCNFIEYFDEGIFVHNTQIGNMVNPENIAGTYDIQRGVFNFATPTNEKEMTAFLKVIPSISERTNILGTMIKYGFANTEQEADELLASCGWGPSGICTQMGWEPGIT